MSTRLSVLALASLLVVASLPAHAQKRAGIMGDLIADVTDVESKIVGLAKAMPEASYAWRPMPGVRSSGEAFTHVAADNYFLPIALGATAPAATGISGTDYKTVEAYEKKTRTRAEIIAEVEQSFAFLKKAMTDTPDAKMDTSIKMFGRESTRADHLGVHRHAPARAPRAAHRLRAQQQGHAALEQVSADAG